MLDSRAAGDRAAVAAPSRDTGGAADASARAAPGSAAPRGAAARRDDTCGAADGGARAALASAALSERQRSWALQGEPDLALRRAARTPQAPWRTLESLTMATARGARVAGAGAAPAAPAAQLPGTALRGPPPSRPDRGTPFTGLICNMAAPPPAVRSAESAAAQRPQCSGKENAAPLLAAAKGLVRVAEGGLPLPDPSPTVKPVPCVEVRRLAMRLRAVREHEAAQAAAQNPNLNPILPRAAPTSAASLAPRNNAATLAEHVPGPSASGWALPDCVRTAAGATAAAAAGKEATSGHVSAPAQHCGDPVLEAPRQERCADGGGARPLTQMHKPPGKGWQPGRADPNCNPSDLPGRQEQGGAAVGTAAGADGRKDAGSMGGLSSAALQSSAGAEVSGVASRHSSCGTEQSGAAFGAKSRQAAGSVGGRGPASDRSAGAGDSGCGTEQSSAGWEPSSSAGGKRPGPWEAGARGTERAGGGVFSGLRVAIDPRLPAEHTGRRAGR